MGTSDPLRRLQIIQTPALKGWTVEQTCAFYAVSPARFYVWRARYAAGGLAALGDHSRRPQRSPHQVGGELEQRIVGLRHGHPRWGAQRIHDELVRAGFVPPATSTIHQVLRRHGLVVARPPSTPPADTRFERDQPNELWQIDAKEDWQLASGALVQLIDVIDDHSRLLCALRAWPALSEEHAWATLTEAIDRYGVPQQLLSDNASWLTARHRSAVNDFERRCWQAGIDTIHGRLYHPQTQGKLERQHRTAGDWLAEQPPAETLGQLQTQLDVYRHHYNHQRPHQGLGQARTPAEVYAATPKAYPTATSPTITFTRLVATNGTIRYSGWNLHLGRRWAGSAVTVIEHNAKLRVTFGDELLAVVALDTELYPDRYISTGKPRGRPPHPPPT